MSMPQIAASAVVCLLLCPLMASASELLSFAGQWSGKGTYKDGEMNVSFSQSEGDGNIRHWRMSMRVEGDHLMYEENRRMNDEQAPLISFAGRMIRQ